MSRAHTHTHDEGHFTRSLIVQLLRQSTLITCSYRSITAIHAGISHSTRRLTHRYYRISRPGSPGAPIATDPLFEPSAIRASSFDIYRIRYVAHAGYIKTIQKIILMYNANAIECALNNILKYETHAALQNPRDASVRTHMLCGRVYSASFFFFLFLVPLKSKKIFARNAECSFRLTHSRHSRSSLRRDNHHS